MVTAHPACKCDESIGPAVRYNRHMACVGTRTSVNESDGCELRLLDRQCITHCNVVLLRFDVSIANGSQLPDGATATQATVHNADLNIEAMLQPVPIPRKWLTQVSTLEGQYGSGQAATVSLTLQSPTA